MVESASEKEQQNTLMVTGEEAEIKIFLTCKSLDVGSIFFFFKAVMPV